MKILFFLFAIVITCLSAPCTPNTSHSQIVPIRLAHSLEGSAVVHLEKIVQKYNSVHPETMIMLKYMGNYTDSFNKVFAEKDRAQRPHLLLVAEYNTQTMMDQVDDYIAIDQLVVFNKDLFIPAIKEFYEKKEGPKRRLVSLPFACSSPVLFYNKKAFKEAGLSIHKPPLTWEEIQKASVKLKNVGYKPFTLAWPVAYMLEHFASIHGLTNIASQPFVDQMTRFVQWAQEGLYVHAQNNTQAEDLFARGQIAMLFQGARRLESLQTLMKDAHIDFDIGVAPYPFEASLVTEPYTPGLGGTSLWVLAGHEREQKGVASFLKYLLKPEVQAEWHQLTGYLPVTLKAFQLTQQSEFYKTHPVHEMACKETIDRPIGPQWCYLDYQQTRTQMQQGIERMLKGADVAIELNAMATQLK